MKRSDFLAQIAPGEDSTRQLKADVKNAGSLPGLGDGTFVNTEGMVLSGHADLISDLLGMEPAA